ncbi:PA domain-containing protein [Flavobacterium sp.]|uniref:PA domain-containing protein n=1 Tax=Flavobacterium sp. TaxID=239 RepID=UPI0033425499
MKKNLLLVVGISLFNFISCTESKLIKSKVNKVLTKENTVFNTSIPNPIIPKAKSNSVEYLKLVSVKPISKFDELRSLHECYLSESPYKETLKKSKIERQALGLPPNKYYESDWEATMDPTIGRPTPEKLEILRQELERQRNEDLTALRTPGDGIDNSWIERGPTNVGGRTRAVIFDPNDVTNETVYAGGVSGGIWKNTNISNENSIWTRVNIPDNLNVTCIAVDPNNPSIFYAGTGESYVGGDVTGDGLWKSTNGGNNWVKVLGGVSGATYFQSGSSVTVNSPALSSFSAIETTDFGAPITTAITSNIVLVDDGTMLPNEGCGPFINAAAVNGKIALIKRGTCPFIQKCTSAVNAGAIAVIVINNVSGIPAAMGGVDTFGTVTIPSVAISQLDGNSLITALENGPVNVTLNPLNSSILTANFVPGIQHINDVAIRNNAGISEIYVAAASTPTAGALLGGNEYGLYKSSNHGVTWTEVALPPTSNGSKTAPNDIEITSGGKIWLSSTNNSLYGEGGGRIFSSSDGITFQQKHSITSGERTQIAVSKTNPDKVYVLTEIPNSVVIVKTLNSFTTSTNLPLPIDADTGIPASDFTRGQAFYDLLIAADPVNDEVLYLGGIDLFKSTNGGTSYLQLSHWYGGFGYQDVHADQHGLAFGNGPSGNTKIVFGNDGGVYYSSDGGYLTTSRNNGFNVTQFYSVGVAPVGATGGNLFNDYFAAGAQDNGTQYFSSVASGLNSSITAQGGDGAFTMFDQGANKYFISNYVYNRSINRRTTDGAVKVINSESTTNGAFICPMVLDSNLDVLFSDYTTGTTYQIRRYTNVGLTGTVVKTILTNPLLTNSPSAFAVSKYTTGSTTLLVGTRNGKVLRLTNANTTPTWTDISSSAFVGTISDIEYGTSNDEIFVTMSNYNVTSIWYTSNGTSATPTWVNKEGNFPDIPVRCILQNPLLPTTEVIVGSDLGVWFTNNFNAASPTWYQSYNGMRNVKVTDLDLRNDNVVFAATYGRGVFSGTFTNTVLNNETFINNKNVSIYPNPVKDNLNINIKDFSGDILVKIMDVNGREVFNKYINNFNRSKELDLSSFSSGIYFLKLIGEDLNYSEKIILE